MNTNKIKFGWLLIIVLSVLCWLMLGAFSCNGSCAELNPKFVSAIHQVETGGREGAIVGDNGAALGPLQIHRVYWIDSGIKGNYLQCTNLAYSTKVMAAYLNRYCPAAVSNSNYEIMARIHNGGPKGPTKKATDKYWSRVRSKLDASK